MNYIELHCHSYFSLLDGASSPDAVIKRAIALDMKALALTDHNAVYGSVRFAKSAEAHGIRPIFGAEITLEGEDHLTLLVKDTEGWNNLCYLISIAQHNAPKGEACLPIDELEGHSSGLIALSGCRQGAISKAILRRNQEQAIRHAKKYQHLFGTGNFWIELQNHLLQEDYWLVGQLVELAEKMGLGYVATNNVHYAQRDTHRLQDVLVCIRHNTTLDESDHLCRSNSEYYLKSSTQMQSLFRDYPKAIANTSQIAEQCNYQLAYGLQDLPVFDAPSDLTTTEYLRKLCLLGAKYRYGDIPSRIQERLDYELSVIARGNLSNYFLIVWDIIRFAKDNEIRCQGRGSAANSLVAYLLDITPVDPLEHNLVFERFLSDERRMTPDIDIDFDANRREEVIQYVYERYGHDHAAMASTLVTFRRRMSVRDVGKTLGLPQEGFPMAVACYGTEYVSEMQEYKDVFEAEEYSPWHQLLELSDDIRGFPRHIGIHNGGMVITKTPLTHRVPTEPATMKDRYVIQWDKDSLEDVGLVKIDILGLRMLSAISEAATIARRLSNREINLDSLRYNDPAVYAMISQADTVGVFQVESRAQAQMIPRFKPTKFTDLIVAISLIRPGPIQGNMVHPYLRRRLGTEPVIYPHPLLEKTLEDTLGVILFQEDVIKVARDLAGFTPGQGELLRRALGSKNAPEAIDAMRDEFISGALDNGVTQAVAEDVFEKLCAFGSYSFPKSHAAAFAVLVYQSAWLKCNHPVAFYIAILNNQPMGFWTPAIIVNDAKRHNINVLPVDVNLSDANANLKLVGFAWASTTSLALEKLLRNTYSQ